ncbi:MAG TPA: N-acetylmuramoyl-L-alanine amidase [Gaiellaceae bacterium]|nr:N-acetylmuramoyl-L-alanine amidase [Gaiellaceae bacterium]
MGLRRVNVIAAAVAASCVLVPAADAAGDGRPPVVWLKGEGNFTKSHRPIESLDQIVVHVTEGAFWGSVQWLQNPRAHASSHYVVSRGGRIVQLVHLSDIAWHAGNRTVNTASVGIEHEGFTYGPGGFTAAQYHASARLAGWIARRSLMPINRRNVIGHRDVPAPGGGRGGASHHTDPGPHWKWDYYLGLVRRYAGVQKLSILPVVPRGPVRGVIPWRAKATGDIRRVEFSVDGRVLRVDRRAPFTYAGNLNTTKLANGRHVLEVHGIAGPGRYDIARRTIVVDNKTFAVTSAGARSWTKVRSQVRLRVRPWGARAASMVFRVDGRRRAVDRRAPFLFTWSAKKAKPGKHVLELVATSVDGRVAKQRIPLVVPAKPKPRPKPKPAAVPPLAIVGQTVEDGQEVTGLVLWRVDVRGRAERVEFLVDGVLRGTDVAAPYTFGWNASAEPPGPHRLTARAVGGKTVEAAVTVTSVGSATP